MLSARGYCWKLNVFCFSPSSFYFFGSFPPLLHGKPPKTKRLMTSSSGSLGIQSHQSGGLWTIVDNFYEFFKLGKTSGVFLLLLNLYTWVAEEIIWFGFGFFFSYFPQHQLKFSLVSFLVGFSAPTLCRAEVVEPNCIFICKTWVLQLQLQELQLQWNTPLVYNGINF